MTHLDTSFVIRALVRGSPEDRRLRGWLSAGEAVGISAISWTELLCGPIPGDDVASLRVILATPLPFAEEHAAVAARLFNVGGRRRGSLLDCMIAAVALEAGAALATSNPADFGRLTTAGLRLVTA